MPSSSVRITSPEGIRAVEDGLAAGLDDAFLDFAVKLTTLP